MNLDPETRDRICRRTRSFYIEATGHPASSTPAVLFDLRGRAAGQFRVHRGHAAIRFNPEAFVRDWNTHFPETIAHEVAHAAVHVLYRGRRVRPHGAEWQAIMHHLGVAPRVRHATPLTPARRQRTYAYICDCTHHALSPQRHALIQKKGYRYQCRHCGGWLRPAE
ncbi:MULTISPECIES: SprT-like domain-containing protein [unclassified Thioalkalivibrio]|uniref:SprT family zinc-dependent metalloprotease n=1 Tax=unclassified Thioalkalivibrio TaxID=2621013 RepID=UPI000366C5B2|nr:MULTISPECIES: SprT-like domain-containing protein [unclassified Thioalkalivibrio]